MSKIDATPTAAHTRLQFRDEAQRKLIHRAAKKLGISATSLIRLAAEMFAGSVLAGKSGPICLPSSFDAPSITQASVKDALVSPGRRKRGQKNGFQADAPSIAPSNATSIPQALPEHDRESPGHRKRGQKNGFQADAPSIAPSNATSIPQALPEHDRESPGHRKRGQKNGFQADAPSIAPSIATSIAQALPEQRRTHAKA